MNIPLSYNLLFQLVQAWDKEINTEPLPSYYPIAVDRSFGDIDIFSFGDHDKVNTFIRKKGIEIEYDDKHDVFKYDGITIEHHKSFLGLISKSARILEVYLQSVASKDKAIVCIKMDV